MDKDLRESATYAAVDDHLRKLHEPGFGTPHALREPHLTADGRHVTVTGVVFDRLDGLPRTAVYTCGDGRLVPLSSGTASARGAVFSPDGSTLAFLSDRGTPRNFQLHLLRSDRLGEAAAAPTVPGSVEYAHWSPDGRQVLLGVAALGADLSGSQGSATVPATSAAAPGGTAEWQPLVETGDEDGRRSLWLYSLDTGEVHQVSPEGVNCWEAGWCGAGHVLAVASEGADEDSWYQAALTLIGTADGSCRELFSSEVQLGLPAGSPDGRTAAVVQAVCSDRWLVAGDLFLIDTTTGLRTAVDTAGTDVTGLQWMDETRLGYVGQRHLDSVAGVVDTTTGRVREVFATEVACGGSSFFPAGCFTADGRVLTVQESYELPQQLVLTDGHTDEVLASVAGPGTDHLRSVGGAARGISWKAPDGLEIEGILCVPEGEGPFPLVVNIHGGPVGAFRNTWSMNQPWVPLLVSRGYAVLNPNPRGSAGRGQEFAGRVVGDMGGDDSRDLLAGIDHLVGEGLVDPARVGLIGGSYGGFMSSWLVTQDTRFAAAVPVSPVTDWYSQSLTSNIGEWGNSFLKADPAQPGSAVHSRSPVFHTHRARTPCLVVAGAKDRCTPPGQAREFHQALRANGVETALVIYPQEGHGVRSYPAVTDFLTRALDWFERHMPARA
ncbi:S9 family peptidase [Streptomyces iconiensis]|uniref:S9 family peptidase n=1 Tax=Streptomyces iconiensis TaxID=1384038 RepID=A0ABT6ZTX1_9ACTN|nr:S9 family peptidase [Streptomyces iconiensis]MDJ1132086.1 S9 family peptidase [Streptomyces iconiensis]